MQFKADERFKCHRTAPSALDLMCFPLGKIKAVGEVMTAMNRDLRDRPFVPISTEAVESLGIIIEDAVEDLFFLVEVAGKQANEIESHVECAALRIKEQNQRI